MKLNVGNDAAYMSPVAENPIMMFTGIDEELMPTISWAQKVNIGVSGYRPDETVLIFAVREKKNTKANDI